MKPIKIENKWYKVKQGQIKEAKMKKPTQQTTIQDNKLHIFINALFTDNDSIAMTNLPEGGHAKAVNITITKENLLLLADDKHAKSLVPRNLNFCICPNPLHPKTRRTADNVKELNAIFLDIDSKNINVDQITPTPHFVFKRNEDHFHIYWLINRLPVNSDTHAKYKKVQKKLVEKYNADQSATDISRLMRLPYTFQIKEKPYTQYKTVIANPELPRYELKEIWQAIKTEDKQPNNTASFIDTDEFIIDFIKSDYSDTSDKIFEGEGRSLELFYLGLNCFGWGLSQEIAHNLAKWLNENFCKPPETDKVLEHQINSAYKYAKIEFGQYRNEVKESNTDKQKRKKLKLYKDCQKVRERLTDFIYVAGIEQMINLNTGFSLTTKSQIENYMAHICGVSIDLHTVIIRKLVRVVERIDFRPDINLRVYEVDGEQYLNRFKGLNINTEEINLKDKESKTKVKLFTDHLQYLTTTDKEYNFLLRYFAYLIQNPGIKLPYAILIISQLEGIGKSMLEVLFRNMLKGYVNAIDNDEIGGGWTDYMADQLMVFVHELAQGERYGIMNKFKNLISSSEYITINGKFARKYTVRNCVNFIFFSNKTDAVAIGENDRRLFVVRNEKQPLTKEYYTTLYKMCNEDFAVIYAYLLSIDLTDFNPYQRPEMTEGKRQLINQSRSELQIFLDGIEQEQKGPFANNLILPADVLSYLEMYGPTIIKFKVGSKAIQNYLIEKHYKPLKIDKQINNNRINKTFWLPENKLKEMKTKDIENELIKILNLNLSENKETASY